MSKEAMKLALEAAYLAGFNASGEGYNGEYPFGDRCQHPEDHSVWCKNRDNALEQVLAKQEQGSTTCDKPVALKPCGYVSAENKMCRKCGQVHSEEIFDTTPQQRTWVGLTDEEHTEIQKQTPYTEFMSPSGFAALCQVAVEAKLKAKNERKEKNNG